STSINRSYIIAQPQLAWQATSMQCRAQHSREIPMNEIPVRIGASIDEIDTPALIVDLDAFERNLNGMAAFAKSAGVRLRPHAKTHKCPTVALKQIAACSVGQCCHK